LRQGIYLVPAQIKARQKNLFSPQFMLKVASSVFRNRWVLGNKRKFKVPKRKFKLVVKRKKVIMARIRF
jgi:hypothetical protein